MERNLLILLVFCPDVKVVLTRGMMAARSASRKGKMEETQQAMIRSIFHLCSEQK